MAAVGSEDDFQPDGNGWWRISLKSHYRTDAALFIFLAQTKDLIKVVSTTMIQIFSSMAEVFVQGAQRRSARKTEAKEEKRCQCYIIVL